MNQDWLQLTWLTNKLTDNKKLTDWHKKRLQNWIQNGLQKTDWLESGIHLEFPEYMGECKLLMSTAKFASPGLPSSQYHNICHCTIYAGHQTCQCTIYAGAQYIPVDQICPMFCPIDCVLRVVWKLPHSGIMCQCQRIDASVDISMPAPCSVRATVVWT